MTVCGVVEAALNKTVKLNILPKPIVMKMMIVCGVWMMEYVKKTVLQNIIGNAVVVAVMQR